MEQNNFENHSYENRQYYDNGPQNPMYGYPPQNPIKDRNVYVIIAVQIWQLILTVFLYIVMFRLLRSQLMYNNLRSDVGTLGFITVISGFSGVCGIVYIVFAVLDIVQINRHNYPIVGLVLFAILLRPAYYIWRCHLLKRKMMPAIIYTVVYYVCTAGMIAWAVWQYLVIVMNYIR